MVSVSLEGVRLAAAANACTGAVTAIPFPSVCPVCGGTRESRYSIACPICEQSLGILSASVCTQCRRYRVFSDSLCDFCGEDASPRSVAIVAMLDGAWRRIIHALKYHGDTSLARPLAALMARCLPDGLAVDTVVAVPTDPHKRRARGYGHAEMLADGIAAIHDLSVNQTVLERTRRTRDQTRLRGPERQANLRGAFRVNDTHDVTGQSILLVDDITTTGATLAEGARALIDAGATSVLAVAVCLNLGLVSDGWS